MKGVARLFAQGQSEGRFPEVPVAKGLVGAHGAIALDFAQNPVLGLVVIEASGDIELDIRGEGGGGLQEGSDKGLGAPVVRTRLLKATRSLVSPSR